VQKIILASRSPRRVELLKNLGIKFEVVPSEYAEALNESRPAEEVAKELARGKAKDVSINYPAAYVIGSDSVVAINGRQMEKPKDLDDAREMLTALAGRESTVSTAVAVVNLNRGIEIVDVDTTKVYFKENTPEITRLREEYLASGDWKDKAGGYGIQSGADILIERIDGSYDTVVGLPTVLLSVILKKTGALKY